LRSLIASSKVDVCWLCCRELLVIFPDFVVPKISQMRLRPEKHPRTLAIIRPDALEQFRGMTTVPYYWRCQILCKSWRQTLAKSSPILFFICSPVIISASKNSPKCSNQGAKAKFYSANSCRFCRQKMSFFIRQKNANLPKKKFRHKYRISAISSKIDIFVTTASFRHFVSFRQKRNPLEPIYTPCSKKSSTAAYIDNSVNFQRIFKIPSLSHSLENLG